MPQYFDPNLLPRTLDSIYDRYLSQQKLAKDEQRQAGADFATYGFNPSILGDPNTQKLVQGQENSVESPQIKLARDFIARKKQAQGLEMQTSQANLGLTQAKTANELAEANARINPSLDPTKTGKVEGDLRGELQNLSKPFFQVRDAMGRIEASAKNPTAAGDLAMIFNYMKVLDPGSTVREGEFATAQNSAGIPARVVASYNKAVNGERLEPGQRQDFLDRARELYKSQESIQKQQEGQYRGLAERMRANPENVILNQGLPAQPALPPPPAAGGISPEAIRAERQRRQAARQQGGLRRGL